MGQTEDRLGSFGGLVWLAFRVRRDVSLGKGEARPCGGMGD